MPNQLDCVVCGNIVADIIGRPVDALAPKYNTGHTPLDEIRLFAGGFFRSNAQTQCAASCDNPSAANGSR